MADDDWDLGAVVRGCRGSGAEAAEAAPRLNTFASFTPQAAMLEAREPEDDKGCSFFAFPDHFRRQDAFQELEELYEAFSKDREQRVAASSPSIAPHTAVVAVAGPHQTPPSRQPHRLISNMPRSKRRKNLQKKVVCHVPATGISSDVWAWRKYGQKPIKGSPYPRGYYRCSSSKACLARKQVERSRADPAMFIITYTAEHNHPVPTHRNSLAGSTRHKSASPASAAAPVESNGDRGSASAPSTTSCTTAGLSPTTPLTVSMEDELLRRLLQEAEVEEEEPDEDDGMLLLVEDMEVAGSDDILFMGVAEKAAAASAGAGAADVAAFFGEDGGDHFFAAPWLANSKSAAAAAGGS